MIQTLFSGMVLKYPRIILLLTLIIIGLLGTQAFKLEIDASSETLLLQDDKDLKRTREINKRYASQDFLVITYTPEADMLSPASIQTIQSLSDALLKLKDIETVTSILNVPLLQSPPKPIKELVENIPTLQSEGTDKTLAINELLSSPIYSENLVSRDFKTTALLLNLKKDTRYAELLKQRNTLLAKEREGRLDSKEAQKLQEVSDAFKSYRDLRRDENHEMIVQIRSIIDRYHDSGKLFLGGVNMITDDMISFIKHDLETYGTILLGLLILVLWVVFRQIRFVLLPVFIALLSVIATTGLLGMFGWEVTVISSNFISLQLIVTMSLVIHLIVRYRELNRESPEADQSDLVLQTVTSMAKPHLFVIITTVSGFTSLVVSEILPIINFGWMMAAGVSISLLITFLVFPTVMGLLSKSKSDTTFDREFTLTLYLAKVVEKIQKPILVAALIVAFFSLSGASRLFVENSFIDYFKDSTEIYQGMKVIDQQLGGTTPLDIVINFPQEKAPEPKPVSSGDDMFNDFEAEFSQTQNDAQYWFTPLKMQTVEKVHDYLESVPQIGKVLSLGTMLKIGRNLNKGEDLNNFELALLYNEIPDKFKNIILNPYLDIENNQVRYTVRIVDSREDLRRDELLKRLKSEIHTKLEIPKEDFQLTGLMVLYNNMLQSLFDSQINTLGMVVLILTVMFLILFRSLKIALVAMLVNIVPVSVVFGFMGWAHIPLDMMTITIAAISLGIAVDNTIHYLYRFKNELAVDGDYIGSMHRSHASIGYAMYYTSLTIIIGFSVLVFSNFIPTIYFGLLTVLAILMALVADLILLPALILLFKPFGKVKPSL